jgi:hypothetical protein
VLAAVRFDCDLPIETNKIQNVTLKSDLSAELESLQSPVPQELPQRLFSVRCRPAHRFCEKHGCVSKPDDGKILAAPSLTRLRACRPSPPSPAGEEGTPSKLKLLNPHRHQHVERAFRVLVLNECGRAWVRKLQHGDFALDLRGDVEQVP